MTEASQGRVVTSAVPTMSVAAVRRALSFMRKHWEELNSDMENHCHRSPMPLYLIEPLPAEIVSNKKPISLQRFSLLFVQGHHAKRCRKRGHHIDIDRFWQDDVDKEKIRSCPTQAAP